MKIYPFIKNQGNYRYNVKPFELKNVGATYQRLVNRMFKDYIINTIKSIRWQYAGKFDLGNGSLELFKRDILDLLEVQHEAKPRKMHVWGRVQ